MSPFLSPPVLMHDGLLCMALRSSGLDQKSDKKKRKIKFSESIKDRRLKLSHNIVHWGTHPGKILSTPSKYAPESVDTRDLCFQCIRECMEAILKGIVPDHWSTVL